MNKRYYKKKGPSFKDRLRCPLCGKLSAIGYFSQNHQFGVYRSWFFGRGDIRWELLSKSNSFMSALKESIVGRLLDLLKRFTGQRYYSQSEVDFLLGRNIKPNVVTGVTVKGIRTIPKRTIPKRIENVKVVMK